MNELMDIRPKMKLDTVFLQVPEGVFLRGDDASFVIKGKSAYRWLSALSPYLTGNHTLRSLCNELEPGQREVVSNLIKMLWQKGVVKHYEPESTDILPEAFRTQFHSQIALIDHYTDQPLARFRRFHESRILLVGAGEALSALSVSLLKNGLGTLTLAPTDDIEQHQVILVQITGKLRQEGIETSFSFIETGLGTQIPDIDMYDIIVYCSDTTDLAKVRQLHTHCMEQKKPFVPAYIVAGKFFLGPLTQPDIPGCWMCSVLRYTANCKESLSTHLWKNLTLGGCMASGDTIALIPNARRAGNGLAFELFKILTGALHSEIENSVVIQDLETLETFRGEFVQHPQCPSCSQLTAPVALERLQAITKEEHNQQLTLDELFTRHTPLIDQNFGLFQPFDDDKLIQIPLKATRLHLNLAASPTNHKIEIMAASVENLQQARYAAYEKGITLYSQAFADSRSMIMATSDDLRHRQASVIEAQQIATWLGLSTPSPTIPIAWCAAYSLHERNIIYVPAGAVYPFSQFNAQWLFEKTLSGTGVAQTFQDTLQQGLISAFGYDQLHMLWKRGSPSVILLDSDVLEADDADLKFLYKSACHFGRTISVMELAHNAPLHIIIARTTDDGAQTISHIGLGLSGPEAAKQALLQLVRDLQLLQDTGVLPDPQQTFFTGFSLRSDLVQTSSFTSRFMQPVISIKRIYNDLHENGRDVLFVDTTPTDIWQTETLISGTVLLTRPD